MKSFKLIPVLLLMTLCAAGQFGMPSLEEVSRHFFTRYNYEETEGYFRLQRKQDGWFVSFEKYGSEELTHTELIWSAAQGKFLPIDYEPDESDTARVTEKLNRYFKKIEWDYNAYGFQRVKYYGYAGWDWDVISDPLLTPVNDTLLESLGRAYSSYAAGFVTDQLGSVFVNNDSDRVLLADNQPISKNRLDKLIQYDEKSIECYSRLRALNPAYETKVGNIAIKEANEYMFLYYWLTLGRDNGRAVEYARKANYPDSLLAFSRNYMETLPLNSILLTGGDNDTYPLWYLQVVQKFRPDIIVLNYSLLGLRKNLLWLESRYSKKLFSTPDSLYLQKQFDYSLYNNKEGGSQMTGVDSFLQHLRVNYNPFFDGPVYVEMEGVRTYYTKTLSFSNDNDPLTTINLGDYLLLNDFMLLDIISHNRSTPVFSTFQVDMLKPMMQFNGTVFEMTK